MGRLWRLGQDKRVQIYRLFICSSIEEIILERQAEKQALSDMVIDGKLTLFERPEKDKAVSDIAVDEKKIKEDGSMIVTGKLLI